MLHLFSKVATIAIVRCRRRQLITPHHGEPSLDWANILTTEHLVKLCQKATVKNPKKLSKKSIFRWSQILVLKKRQIGLDGGRLTLTGLHSSHGISN